MTGAAARSLEESEGLGVSEVSVTSKAVRVEQAASAATGPMEARVEAAATEEQAYSEMAAKVETAELGATAPMEAPVETAATEVTAAIWAATAVMEATEEYSSAPAVAAA